MSNSNPSKVIQPSSNTSSDGLLSDGILQLTHSGPLGVHFIPPSSDTGCTLDAQGFFLGKHLQVHKIRLKMCSCEEIKYQSMYLVKQNEDELSRQAVLTFHGTERKFEYVEKAF
ncbi:hypothetical protein Tco_0960588 [Tanacetum coccineum]